MKFVMDGDTVEPPVKMTAEIDIEGDFVVRANGHALFWVDTSGLLAMQRYENARVLKTLGFQLDDDGCIKVVR